MYALSRVHATAWIGGIRSAIVVGVGDGGAADDAHVSLEWFEPRPDAVQRRRFGDGALAVTADHVVHGRRGADRTLCSQSRARPVRGRIIGFSLQWTARPSRCAGRSARVCGWWRGDARSVPGARSSARRARGSPASRGRPGGSSRARLRCRVLGQHRSTRRRIPRGRDDEDRLVADVIELARRYGSYGYRRIAALLRDAGWQVNDKRVERIWRREGLKVPGKQPKRGRLWLNDGICVRLRAERADHVWSYDFVCIAGPMTDGLSARSTSWTSSPGRAWRSGFAGSFPPLTSSMS